MREGKLVTKLGNVEPWSVKNLRISSPSSKTFLLVLLLLVLLLLLLWKKRTPAAVAVDASWKLTVTWTRHSSFTTEARTNLQELPLRSTVFSLPCYLREVAHSLFYCPKRSLLYLHCMTFPLLNYVTPELTPFKKDGENSSNSQFQVVYGNQHDDDIPVCDCWRRSPSCRWGCSSPSEPRGLWRRRRRAEGSHYWRRQPTFSRKTYREYCYDFLVAESSFECSKWGVTTTTTAPPRRGRKPPPNVFQPSSDCFLLLPGNS